MTTIRNVIFLTAAWLVATTVSAQQTGRAQGTGRIEGTVLTLDGSGLGGVEVTLEPMARTAWTNQQGGYALAGVPAGTYSIAYKLGDLAVPARTTTVAADETTTVDIKFEEDFNFAQAITVESASRRVERLVDAPAAMTQLSQETVHLEGGSGQIPRLLQFTAGVDMTQSGLYDINLNARGFNGFLTRRVQTIIDGRDPSGPSTSSQEWWTLALLTDEFDSVELLRGPSSALYGANSVNGVLSLTTRAPRDSPGGRFRLTAGDLDTVMGDARWAGPLGKEWYVRLVGNGTQSESFLRPRNESVEYDGLGLEAVPPSLDEINFQSGNVRLDKYFANGDRLTLESGIADGDGETYVGNAGRFQQLDIRRWYSRVNYNASHWNAGFYYNDRYGDHLLLGANVHLFNDDWNYKFEVQGHHQLADGRLRLVGGVSYIKEESDSADPNTGRQSLYYAKQNSDKESVFGQADYDLTSRLKVVVAARYDDSTLHDSQISPKAALVFQPAAGHSLRVGFNKAFQVGNYTEFYLNVPAALPIDLSAVEASLAPLTGGVPLGLGFVPILAFGNESLEVEKIQSFEAGYRGLLGKRTLLSIDYHRDRMEDFISNLGVGVNASFPAYRAPAGLPAGSAAIVEGTLNGAVPGLSNGPDGAPIVALSFGNIGKVDSQGVEFDVKYQPHSHWLVGMTYAWMDFEAKEPGADVSPNTPEHRATVGITYRPERLAASLNYRWVDAFDWAAGIYAGPVPAQQLVDLNVGFDLTTQVRLGLNVNNLLANEHYEIFGGDILGRRALGSVAFSW